MNKFFRITNPDSHRIRIIAFFIFAFAAGGVIQPFLNLYLVEVGFSGTQVGVLQGYTSLAIVIITPLIGWLADRTQRHRLLLGIIVTIKGLSAPAMLLSTAWSWLAATVSIRVMTAGSQDALMNRLTMADLNNRGKINFGGTRFWGALSFAFTSLLTGWLARDHSVSILFPLSGIFGLIAALCVTGFPARISPLVGTIQLKNPIRRPRALVALFLLIFLITLGKSGYDIFANIFIKTDLGASNTWIGLFAAVGSLTTVFAFAFVDQILARLKQSGTLALGFMLFALSYIFLALAPNPIWVLPAIIINSIAGAFFLVSVVVILSQLGNSEQASTDQMLAQLTIPGLAGILAQPISGWIFDSLGGKTLFLGEAAITLLSIFIIYINRRLFCK